jgi:uncharacterized protein YkwD
MNIFLRLFKGVIFFIVACQWVYADEPSVEQAALAAHNHFRAVHHAPPLVWDTTLANYAERYAAKCKFKHSSSPYGENLAAGYPTVNVAVNAWYAEQAQYSYLWPGFSYKTGHFTQVVWKSTQKLGCAFVLCDGKNGTPGHYLVCEYSPHGNVTNSGYFRANVLKA